MLSTQVEAQNTWTPNAKQRVLLQCAGISNCTNLYTPIVADTKERSISLFMQIQNIVDKIETLNRYKGS